MKGKITDYIPEGRDRAVTRERLCDLTGMPDRKVRELIERARRGGEIIINAQDGAGYYRSEDLRDVARQYKLNEKRALAILSQQKHLRRRLKAAGMMDGKKVVLNDHA